MGCIESKDKGSGGGGGAAPAQPATGNVANGAQASGIIMGSSDAFKKKLDPKDFMFLERTRETLVKEPGSVAGQQFVIMDCNDCDIFLCDHCEMVTIDRCKNSRIFIGPCESSIFVRNCSQLKLVAACRQFRTRECDDMDVLLLCQSQPSIETSSRLRFGCFQYFYFSLGRQFELAKLSPFNNRWSEVYNFTSSVGTHALLDAETDPHKLLRPLHEVSSFVSAEEVAQWRTQSPVPLSVGPAAALRAEASVLLCSPRLHVGGALDLVHALQAEDGLVLARSIEFSVDAQWQPKLQGALATCAERGFLEAIPFKAAVIVLQVAGEGSLAKAMARAAAVNGSVGSSVVYASRTSAECEHMANQLFVSDDSGHSHVGGGAA